ncbi:hypothetical protein M427DRAFT_34431 [Gonapodya prolifera JEL478]|uniref:Uncharacterized protein n=1 Tax=Gonapodya prolifera (strain JEL478) TaxID=1344416 RepID=A0A139A7L9_GONPJ|nr:hypothetical protein M427DRAFT_34431 [Gonapodya prolifera JEL478]|eukprot:KXS12792.1 hypothetical protein M427DRAFT_34431 [Gonapodya prolifera JEL478]
MTTLRQLAGAPSHGGQNLGPPPPQPNFNATLGGSNSSYAINANLQDLLAVVQKMEEKFTTSHTAPEARLQALEEENAILQQQIDMAHSATIQPVIQGDPKMESPPEFSGN